MPFDAPAVLAEVVENVIKSALRPVLLRLRDLEVRLSVAPEPGPPGPAGADGKDGQDGLGFDDYTVTYDGERTFTHVWTKGDQRKEMVFHIPLPFYRGWYQPGHRCEAGDLVTANGALFHCNTETSRAPGDGSKDWTLMVKSGKR